MIHTLVNYPSSSCRERTERQSVMIREGFETKAINTERISKQISSKLERMRERPSTERDRTGETCSSKRDKIKHNQSEIERERERERKRKDERQFAVRQVLRGKQSIAREQYG